MTRQVFAGIDGGGTKTSLVIVDQSGTELFRLQSSTSNAAVVGHDTAGTVLRRLLQAAKAKTDADAHLAGAWFGLSGSDRPEDHRQLRPFVEDLVPDFRMTNDAELVLGALPDAVGVAVVSGTGSIAFGRNAAGDRARSGGWGQIIGDEGSGYDLARRMLDAYAREVDGRGPGTSLTPRLMEHLKLSEPHQLIAFIYGPDTIKADIAQLSQLVIDEANGGDDVALGIIHDSADQLVETAAAVARRLGFEHSLSVALTGGLLVHIERFRIRLLTGLRLEWPGLHHVIVDDPALTAAQAIAHASKNEVVTS